MRQRNKTGVFQMRVSDEFTNKLDYCAKIYGLNKTEVVEVIVERVYDRLKEKEAQDDKG